MQNKESGFNCDALTNSCERLCKAGGGDYCMKFNENAWDKT